MEALAKKEQLNELFDLYGVLLSDKQKLYFELYYLEDYSLQEISELYQVSRNAVFDLLKKAEEHLLDYELKLKLKEKKDERLKVMDDIEEAQDISLLERLRKLDT